MSALDIVAMWIGYVLAGCAMAYIALLLWAWIWWPFAEMVAEIRVFFADSDNGGWKNFRWWILPRVYWRGLKSYRNNLFTYGEGSTTWHGVGVWRHPTHPFTLGRIEWFQKGKP